MSKLNLIELCLSPDLGGLELYMLRCSKALNDSFNVVSVINSSSKLEEYFENEKYKYEVITKKSNLLMFFAARKLAQIIDENSIDIIHLHWTKDIPIAVMAKKISSKNPALVQTRNMTMTRFKDDFYHKFLYENISLMLPVTIQVKEQLERFIPNSIRPKIEVLYMGSDSIELLNDDGINKLKNELRMSESFNIGMVGRIEEAKGQYLLIEAIEKLVKKGLHVKAYFVGHPMKESYLVELKEIVKNRNLEDHIEFLGFMKNPHHFMQACDAIVLATPCETFGLVVIEAMHVKSAVIATSACGPLEIIDDGISGLLFENKNSENLSSQIQKLYEDEELKDRVVANGYKRANEKFSNELQFVKLEKILKDML